MGLHRCTEPECPHIGQATSRSCGCHRTDEHVLRAVIREQLAADDAMMAFILVANPKMLGEDEWKRQHADLSARRSAATSACRAAVAGRDA